MSHVPWGESELRVTLLLGCRDTLYQELQSQHFPLGPFLQVLLLSLSPSHWSSHVTRGWSSYAFKSHSTCCSQSQVCSVSKIPPTGAMSPCSGPGVSLCPCDPKGHSHCLSITHRALCWSLSRDQPVPVLWMMTLEGSLPGHTHWGQDKPKMWKYRG